MSIPVSSIMSVNVVVGATFPSRAGFGTLTIVTNEEGIGPAERIRSYGNMDGVAADYADTTEVYKAANTYFSQQPKPTSLKIANRFETAQSAQLRGASSLSTDLSSLLVISDGSFTISIDGVEEEITGLDFSDGEATLQDIAATIQAALRLVAAGGYTLATCSHDGVRFSINSGTTGALSTISFATSAASGTDISSLLKLNQAIATKSNGMAGETITASLNAIQDKDPDWYGFIFTKEVRDLVQINGEDAVEAAATWAESRDKIFGNTTNSFDVFDSVTTTDIGSVIQSLGFRRTMTVYCSDVDKYPSASVFGRAFTVNFNQADSTITLNFKQLPGIPVENLTVSQKNVMRSKNVNAYINIGGESMFFESVMGLDGHFFDEVHGVDWLTNAIQTQVFGYIKTRPTKVPFLGKGTAAIQQQITGVFDEALRNGLIGAGTTIDGEFLPLGYKINVVPVDQVNQSDKSARQYNGISFVIIGAGAIHGVQINGVFER